MANESNMRWLKIEKSKRSLKERGFHIINSNGSVPIFGYQQGMMHN